MRLFWIGNRYFCNELPACGWGRIHHFDFRDFRVFGWKELVAEAGFEADVLVVGDKSLPPFVLGMEDFPCLTVFYAIDSHLQSWYPLYAQGFDVCLVSLKDHLPRFAGEFLPRERIFWTPPCVAGDARPPETMPDKQWDCLFVGTVNANTPMRAAFLKELGRHLPGFHYTSGNFCELFPKGRILLNICENDDLNFRVFEALGMGGCLLTPSIGHGQDELFQDGVHLVLYRQNDVQDALARIRALLDDAPRRERLACAGLAEIDAHHRARHRAQAFTEHMRPLLAQKEAITAARRARAADIRQHCLKLPYLLWAQEMADEKVKQQYLAAASGRYPSI